MGVVILYAAAKGVQIVGQATVKIVERLKVSHGGQKRDPISSGRLWIVFGRF